MVFGFVGPHLGEGNMRYLAFLCWVLVALVAQMERACAVPPGESFVYKEIDSHQLNIYVTKPADWNEADHRPAIVFFHGGGWVGGAPGQFTEHAKYFASRGLVCFQVQYRLLDKATKDPPTNCVEDAVSAMQWVRRRSNEFGIDSKRIASAGGSAGGHLAAYVGTVEKIDKTTSSRSNAMVLFNPVYDNGPGGWGTARVGERWQEFSPMHNLSAESPPSIVFLGTQDKLIPVETGEEFLDRSREYGVQSELHTYEGQPHGFFNYSRDGGKWFFQTVVAADKFLQSIGWLVGEATLARPFADNVVLITLDGLRSEEVFGGADKRLMIPELGAKDPSLLEKAFYRENPKKNRELLLPFIWSQVAKGAWIAGDITRDSRVEVTNGKYFSYPGYNELLTGAADDRVDSNAKRYNENVTVLEWLSRKPEFTDEVAAYCSWEVFPYIINDRRSNIPVNAGWSPLTAGNADRSDALNFVAKNLFHQWEGVRYDAFTVAGALEHVRSEKPRLLYVSLGETDDWAHGGRYDRYLLTAKQNDYFIQQLWEQTQSMDQYRDKTAFIIATDHGRGDGREGWKNHSDSLPGSEYIWVAAWGAGVTKSGIDVGGSYTQSQVAATVAAALGYDFTSFNKEIAESLPIVAFTDE